MTAWIKPSEAKYMPLHTQEHGAVLNLGQERLHDSISHFTLVLAFCRTEDLRRWLVNVESALFRHRWATESERGRRAFVDEVVANAGGWAYVKATREEKRVLAKYLFAATPSVNPGNLEEIDFYKVRPIGSLARMLMPLRCRLKMHVTWWLSARCSSDGAWLMFPAQRSCLFS